MTTSARRVKSGSYQLDQRQDGTVHLTVGTSGNWEGERTIELSPADVAALAKDLVDVLKVST